MSEKSKKEEKSTNLELVQKTLVIIKPNVINSSLIGEIINFFEKNNLKILGIKMLKFFPQKAQIFYQDHAEKPFFTEMIDSICSSPVVALCLGGKNAVKLSRKIIGATNPLEAETGTVRKIYGKSITANAVHGSDSTDSAEREIGLLFSRREIFT